LLPGIFRQLKKGERLIEVCLISVFCFLLSAFFKRISAF
jgi:hypothetical protein